MTNKDYIVKVQKAKRKGCCEEDTVLLESYYRKCTFYNKNFGSICPKCHNTLDNKSIICRTGFGIMCIKCYDKLHISKEEKYDAM